MKKHLIISGKVQGVGFRYWLQNYATQKGVFGWVRNLNTGQVEVFLMGGERTISELIEACELGPTNSLVEHIEISDSKDPCPTESFEILPTI